MIIREPLRVIGGRTARLEPGPDGAVKLRPSDEPPGELYVGPGWADAHAHVYDGMTEIGVAADDVGLATGVHLLGDAGERGRRDPGRAGQVRDPRQPACASARG